MLYYGSHRASWGGSGTRVAAAATGESPVPPEAAAARRGASLPESVRSASPAPAARPTNTSLAVDCRADALAQSP